MRWSNLLPIGLATAALGMFAFATSSQAGKPWQSVVVDNDFAGECFTGAPGTSDPSAPGGLSCFGTTQFVPSSGNILRVRWSTAGDQHDGAALRIACRIRPATTGEWSFCNPTGTGAAPGDYITKGKTPAGTDATNCNDGSGGDGDCHDNSIEMTWCVPILGDDVYDIDLRLASSDPGGVGDDLVFVEASYFYVDSTKVDGQCGAGDASATTAF
jgi:hypothetical protein